MLFKYKGIEVSYDLNGNGDSLVLLHGFLETSSMWNGLVGEFKSTHQVVTLDLMGHGKTGCLGYVHSMTDMALMVVALLDHLTIKSAKFIGHSMGGYVALALNEVRPDMVKGLCLMNSTYRDDSDERKALRARAIEMAKSNYENLVRMSFANLFAPASRITYKTAFESALKVALSTPVQGYIAAMEGMRIRPERQTSFLNVMGPKALVIGKKDTIVDGKLLKSSLEFTDVEVCELSEGHMSHIENMYDLTYFLLRFIQK